MPRDLDRTALLVIGVQSGLDNPLFGPRNNPDCEATARMARDLGYNTLFVLDATQTFDLPAHGGGTISADELARVTASNLQDEFADVVMTADLV